MLRVQRREALVSVHMPHCPKHRVANVTTLSCLPHMCECFTHKHGGGLNGKKPRLPTTSDWFATQVGNVCDTTSPVFAYPRGGKPSWEKNSPNSTCIGCKIAEEAACPLPVFALKLSESHVATLPSSRQISQQNGRGKPHPFTGTDKTLWVTATVAYRYRRGAPDDLCSTGLNNEQRYQYRVWKEKLQHTTCC